MRVPKASRSDLEDASGVAGPHRACAPLSQRSPLGFLNGSRTTPTGEHLRRLPLSKYPIADLRKPCVSRSPRGRRLRSGLGFRERLRDLAGELRHLLAGGAGDARDVRT